MSEPLTAHYRATRRTHNRFFMSEPTAGARNFLLVLPLFGINPEAVMKNLFRLILVTATLALWGSIAGAQVERARIGVLGAPEEPRFSEVVNGLKHGLLDLGYAENSFEILEGRVARGKERDGGRSVIEGLAHKKAQVLFVIGSRLIKPARQVTPAIPIVFITPGDPVAAGFVSSLSHPGGNITGLTFEYPELSGKRLQVLQEMVPQLRRVFAFYDPRDASPTQGAAAARQAARELRITLLDREIRTPDEITQALSRIGDADAFLGIPGGLPTGHYRDIIRAANSNRVPTMFHAHSGSTKEALASYGTSDAIIARQSARVIDKIFKGADAGSLPIERPIKLQLTINLKTAKQIGLTIPPNVLARADRVIK
jgi:putative ABC transport system substrate-binding protein